MENKIKKMEVKGMGISVIRIGSDDYISLTDLAKYANEENPSNVIIHWMSNKGTFNLKNNIV